MKEFKQLLQRFEADGRHAMGVELPARVAAELRWELYQLYGADPGKELTTLFGVAVLSTDADQIRFEE